MTLAEREHQIATRYAVISDAHERLSAIVSAGSRLAPLREGERTDERLVPGCQSQVWIAGGVEEGLLHVRADAASPMVKGLVAMVVEAFDGLPAGALEGAVFTLPERLGLTRTLSPTRLHGLAQVERRIRALASTPPPP